MVAALLERPAMRELRHHECWHDAIIDLESAYLKNDREAIPMILANVKEFLALSTRGGQDSETNNAIRAAAAAIVGTQLDMQGKKAAVGRLLGLTLARTTEAIQQRKQTMATPTPEAGGRWRRKAKGDYSNKYGASVKGVVVRFLHEQSMPDNNSKRGLVKVAIEVAHDGTVVYDLHPPVYIAEAAELFNELTGRDHSKEKVKDPHTGFKVCLALTSLHRTIMRCKLTPTCTPTQF
jgi:hypothetical protein